MELLIKKLPTRAYSHCNVSCPSYGRQRLQRRHPNRMARAPNRGENSDQHRFTEKRFQFVSKIQCIHFKLAAKSVELTPGKRRPAQWQRRRVAQVVK